MELVRHVDPFPLAFGDCRGRCYDLEHSRACIEYARVRRQIPRSTNCQDAQRHELERIPKGGVRTGRRGGDEGHLMDLVQVSPINTSLQRSVARISGSRADARRQYSRKISMTWKEKSERICRGGTRLPVHDVGGPSLAFHTHEASLRGTAGR